MKRALIVLFALTFLNINLANAQATCQQALKGTFLHFSVGDGASPYIEVFKFSNSFVVTDILSGTSCTFLTNACPTPPPAGVDGHDIPGLASCAPCAGATGSLSINQAKCCIIHGQTTNPSDGSNYC